MVSKMQDSSDPIDKYIREHSLRLTPEQDELVQYTATLPSSYSFNLNLGSCASTFSLQEICRTCSDRSTKRSSSKCSFERWDASDAVSASVRSYSTLVRRLSVEVGTFTGYTALTIALALPADGQLIALDIDDQYIRQDLWKKAGVSEKIQLKLGSGTDTLQALLEENGPGSFDFVFIDADKVNYLKYYELALQLIRSNGIIAIDNTLWDGQVLDESDTSDMTVAIRQVNDFVRDDQRVDISFLRLGDGTTLCRKK